MDQFMIFFTAAFAIEGLVEYIASGVFSGKMLQYLSLVVGLAFAYGFGLDIFTTLGLHPVAPWVGQLATGLVLGRGSNALNDLISKTRVSTGDSSAVSTK